MTLKIFVDYDGAAFCMKILIFGLDAKCKGKNLRKGMWCLRRKCQKYYSSTEGSVCFYLEAQEQLFHIKNYFTFLMIRVIILFNITIAGCILESIMRLNL